MSKTKMLIRKHVSFGGIANRVLPNTLATPQKHPSNHLANQTL